MSATKRLKYILIDIAGAILIIAGIALGWLPGPGGVPLLIAGLSLLSINHDWAKRWLNKIKASGNKIMEQIFTSNRTIMLMWDLISLILLASAAWVFTRYNRGIFISLSLSLAAAGLGLLLGNRGRFKKLKKRFKSR